MLTYMAHNMQNYDVIMQITNFDITFFYICDVKQTSIRNLKEKMALWDSKIGAKLRVTS